MYQPSKYRVYTIIIVLIGTMIIISCYRSAKMVEKIEKPFELVVPKGFPFPEIPEDNQLTSQRIALGKKLFYDPILSLDSTVSCGTCHQASSGFATNDPVAIGIQGRMGMRNAPTLTNVAYHPYFFAEGGSPSLELQVIGPICNQDEFGFNAALLGKRLEMHEGYRVLAQEAYGRNIDLYVLVRAIAAFERTLISGNSPYDQYVFQSKKNALSESEINGMELFFSERLGCAKCHAGFNFTNYSFENIGLYESYTDFGRYRVSLEESDKGKFKVPTLRNVALTAPYMHNGSMATLEEVIAHFQTGGHQHPNKSELVGKFVLSSQEKEDLIHFLHALTDSSFIHNKAFR